MGIAEAQPQQIAAVSIIPPMRTREGSRTLSQKGELGILHLLDPEMQP